MKLESMYIVEKKRRQLKKLFPEIFIENQIDYEQLKHILGNKKKGG